MRISTKRLTIRPLEIEDQPHLFQYMSNERVMKYIPEGTYTREGILQFILENQGEQMKHFAVLEKQTKQLIGHLAFHPYFGKHTYEIGWVFHPTFHRQGYATEAAQAMIAYGFEELNIHRIIATCQPENTASYRVMENIGMRKEGHFLQCIPAGNQWWDEYYYAILQEEYRANQRTLIE